MSKKHRNYGIDLVKILACILVITLHCLSPSTPVVKNNIFNSSLYYVGTLAIPIFFMASGFFVLNKRSISYVYSFKRIKNILFVVISWILLFSIIRYLFKHNFDFFQQLKGSLMVNVPQQHFYHFWFFWALIIMILLAPMLWWLLQKSFNGYLLLLIFMTLICVTIDFLLHFGLSKTVQNTPQILRLYLYIEYYLLGGYIGNIHFKKIFKFISKHFFIFSLLDIFLYFLLIGYSLWNRNIINWIYAEANYGNLLTILTSALTFCLFTISIPRATKIIEFIIPATMGIYMLHPFFIGKLLHFKIFANYPSTMIIIIFIICLIIVELALRIPYINKLFKL